jgi:O-antigen/teichoic acid export membrane protein
MLAGLGLSAVSASVMAVSYAIYLRCLGYEQYGLWLILSTVIAFSQVGNLGISQAVTKKVAECWAARELPEISAHVTAACGVVIGSGMILVFFVVGLRYYLTSLLHLSSVDTKTVVLMLPFVAILSVYLFVVDISNATLNGLGRLDYCVTCQLIAQSSSLLSSVLFLWMRGGLWALFWGNVIGYASAHLVSICLAARIMGHVPLRIRLVRLRHVKNLLTIGGWMLGCATTNLLLNPINRGILARFGGVELVPLYDIPFNSCMRIRSLFDNSQKALVAEVSGLAAIGDYGKRRRIRQIYSRAFRLMLLAAPMFMATIVCADPMLKLWLGKRYDPAMTNCFQAISVGVFAATLGIPAYYVLLGLGQAVSLFKANVIQALTNIGAVAAIVTFAHAISAVDMAIAVSLGLACGGMSLIWQERKNQTLSGSLMPCAEI